MKIQHLQGFEFSPKLLQGKLQLLVVVLLAAMVLQYYLAYSLGPKVKIAVINIS